MNAVTGSAIDIVDNLERVVALMSYQYALLIIITAMIGSIVVIWFLNTIYKKYIFR